MIIHHHGYVPRWVSGAVVHLSPAGSARTPLIPLLARDEEGDKRTTAQLELPPAPRDEWPTLAELER